MTSINDWFPPNETPNEPLSDDEPAFRPTEEQEAILTAVKETDDNILISALAGAAKTSTLVLIAHALPRTAILCLAFNVRIAKEMQERLPSTCKAMTLNSCGHRAWANFLNKKFLEVDTRKTYRIVKQIIEDGLDGEAKRWAYSNMAQIMRDVDAGKSWGYVPTGHYPHAKRLMDDEEYFASLDEEPIDLHKEILQAAALISLKEAHQGVIDFGDQLLCPTVFPASFVQYPLVMVDEAQDLSALNHAMLRKLVKKRIIAVGDECQSIYGFRGAHEDSMSLLKKEFSMQEFILSISFRCPISVVLEARWRAPHMRHPDWAKPGRVEALGLWEQRDIPDHGVILCRNNAPLFSIAIRLLKSGRYPELVGNDIGKQLIKTLAKLGPTSMSKAETMGAIDMWEAEKLEKSRNPGKVKDQAACLRIFADLGSTLGDAVAYAERVLAAAGPIKLMTGHKAKGLEFDDVFILDQYLIGKDPQDQNLRYVMQTRAKSTLTYIRSELFEEENEE